MEGNNTLLGNGNGYNAGLSLGRYGYSYFYNAKEWNTDNGLNWYDYGKRWYDPTLGRFPSVDPIIDEFPYLTPYNYASNSPVTNIDLWGLQGVPTTAAGGWQYMWKTSGLTNDWSGIDKLKKMAKDVAVEGAKMIATMALMEFATPLAIRFWGLEGAEAAAVATSLRSERTAGAAVSDVRQAALDRASLELSSKPRPTATAAVKDSETGKIYTDISGKPHPKLNKALKDNEPNPSKEPWAPCNCAETKAANQAVNDGAKVKNLQYHTVYTKTGNSMPPCKNCQETLKGATHVKH